MSSVFSIICWLSVAGSLLALVLLVARRALPHWLPQSWYYYLWLIVLMRLLLPLHTPLNTTVMPLLPEPPRQTMQETFHNVFSGAALDSAETPSLLPTPEQTMPEQALPEQVANPNLPHNTPQPTGLPAMTVTDILGLLWLGVAAILFLRSLVCYFIFRFTLRRNSQEICQPEILRIYEQSGAMLGLKKLPPLWVSNMVHTPMQLGLLSPVLLLPHNLLQEQEQNLHYFLLHELVHYRRRDVLFKWVTQLCACLHWFNPLAYVMRREINALCELSCDAKVLGLLQPGERAGYGQMLLQALEATVRSRPPRLYGVHWSTELKTMKGRLTHIMRYEKQKKPLTFLLIALTVVLAACGIASGPINDVTPTLVAAPPATAEPTVALVADEQAIIWQEPALEALVREKLGKPDDAIVPGDLDDIWGIELFGDTHIYFNGEVGGYVLGYMVNPDLNDPFATEKPDWEKVDLHLQQDSEGNQLRDGAYTVGQDQYARGSISSIADFANFRNLQYLYVYKNDLRDLAGLDSLAGLFTLSLWENNIQDISSLAQMEQVLAIELLLNQIEDLTPLAKLGQAGKLNTLELSYNKIADLTPLAGLNLHTLRLSNNQITDLTSLAGLGSLSTLVLTQNQITSLQSLGSLDLQVLVLNDNPVSSLEELKSMNNLRSLGLSGTLVDDISVLTGMPDLESVVLDKLKTSNLDLAPLSALPKLYFLSITQDQAQLLNFRSLAELKELKYLFVTPNLNVPAEDIAWLQAQLPNCKIE